MELALPETNRQGRYRFHAPWRNLSVCSTFIEYHSFHEGLTLLVLSLFYGLPILVFACGHVPGGRTARTESAPDMTIVVAARNESERIEACLKALLGQDVPCPIVVVDDHSEDDTARKVRAFAPRVTHSGPRRHRFEPVRGASWKGCYPG